jgi:ribulose-bisphosphate carboxylase large chain
MSQVKQRVESAERLAVTYRIAVSDERNIEDHAIDLAVEQSVEIPHECIPDEITERGIVGQVESIEPILGTEKLFDVVVSYRCDNTAFSVPQFINVVYGNISMKRGVKVVGLDLPSSLLEAFGGPVFGIDGVRSLTGVLKRPIACTALKPIGLSTKKLASMAADYARGGLDILKEDHAMADLVYHPFAERVERCQEAITKTNASTGGNTLYFPMISGGYDEIEKQVSIVKNAGCLGVLVAPMLVGADLIRVLARRHNLAVMTHPALTGIFYCEPSSGMSMSVLLGTIFRVLGADISIFPNAGGRFDYTDQECRETADMLRNPLGSLKPTLPCPAGGMKLDRIGTMAENFGEDTVLLIGGGLMQYSSDLAKSASVFMEAIRKHFDSSLTMSTTVQSVTP